MDNTRTSWLRGLGHGHSARAEGSLLDPPNDLQAVEARRWAAQVARVRARNIGFRETGVLYACGVDLFLVPEKKNRECVATNVFVPGNGRVGVAF